MTWTSNPNLAKVDFIVSLSTFVPDRFGRVKWLSNSKWLKTSAYDQDFDIDNYSKKSDHFIAAKTFYN